MTAKELEISQTAGSPIVFERGCKLTISFKGYLSRLRKYELPTGRDSNFYTARIIQVIRHTASIDIKDGGGIGHGETSSYILASNLFP